MTVFSTWHACQKEFPFEPGNRLDGKGGGGTESNLP